MEIGSAIKLIRKQLGLSQILLAENCNLSVNALSQIETNATFPQKKTLNKICDNLKITTTTLLFFAITEEDVPKEKQLIFKTLKTLLIQ